MLSKSVDRFETDNLLVSTILADDSNVYETGIASPYYNNNYIIIVETYKTYSEAQAGHNSWVRVMNTDYENLPDVLKVSHSTALSFLSELAGCQQVYEKLPKDAV